MLAASFDLDFGGPIIITKRDDAGSRSYLEQSYRKGLDFGVLFIDLNSLSLWVRREWLLYGISS